MGLSDPSMIRLGQALVLTGVIIMRCCRCRIIGTIAGLMVIGLGCAPIYPSSSTPTPTYFGKDKSQAIVGMQMAFAYEGSMHASGVRPDCPAYLRQPVPVVSRGVPGAHGGHATKRCAKSVVARSRPERQEHPRRRIVRRIGAAETVRGIVVPHPIRIAEAKRHIPDHDERGGRRHERKTCREYADRAQRWRLPAIR